MPEAFLAWGSREHSFVNREGASKPLCSITAVSFASSLSSALAAEIDRTTASAPPDAQRVTVAVGISADGRVAPTPRRASDTTPYVDVQMSLKRVDPLEPLRRWLPEGWALATGSPKRKDARDATVEDLRLVHQPCVGTQR